MVVAVALPLRAFDIFAPQTVTPVSLLQKIKLKQDVTLANGPDIYLKLNDLSSKHDQLDDPAQDLKTEAAFVWMSNPGEDAKKTSFTFHKGETLLQVIKAVAAQRHETVVDQKSYILIFAEKHPELQENYMEPSSDVSGALGRWIGANIPPGKTSIQAMPGPAFTDFVNGKFRESLSYFPGPDRRPVLSEAGSVGQYGDWEVQRHRRLFVRDARARLLPAPQSALEDHRQHRGDGTAGGGEVDLRHVQRRPHRQVRSAAEIAAR
jgi:hypothetical protein